MRAFRRISHCLLYAGKISQSTRYIEDEINDGGKYCIAIDYLVLADSMIRFEEIYQKTPESKDNVDAISLSNAHLS